MVKKILLVTWLSLGLNFAYAQEYKPVAQNVFNLEAQNKFIETPNIFSISNEKIIPASVVENAGILNFNSDVAIELIAASPENIQLSIPMSATKSISLKLFRSDLFTPDFTIVTSSQKDGDIISQIGLHYWGIIDNDYSSIASISIFKNEVMGMISSPATGNIILGTISGDKYLRHIIFRESDFHVSTGPNCSTTDVPGFYKNKDMQLPTSAATNCIRLYWEVNYDMYQNKGSVANVTNYITGIFNQSAILFANDGIPVSLSQLFIWDSVSPYTSTTTSGLLGQFQSYRNSFNGDLGHLIGLAGGGGIAASTNGLCNGFLDYSQCYSGVAPSYVNVPTFSWTVEVVTHEQGHLMGAKHTHACVWNGNNTPIDACGPAAGYAYEGSCSGASLPSNGGTIMSYCHLLSTGINFSNGFGTQPKNVILNRVNTASCLSSCTPVVTCDMPTGMITTSITTNSATLAWAGVAGASSYNVLYRISGTTTWTSVFTTATSFQVTGLTSGSIYEWQVKTVCSGSSSAFTSSTNFTTTTVATCGVPLGLSVISTSTTGTTVTWSAVNGATSYILKWKLVSETIWSSATNFSANSFALSGLVNCSSYQIIVQAVCPSGISANSSTATFTTSGCQVNYCISKGTNSTNEYINKVAFGSINNTSGNNNGYGDYTAVSTNLVGNNSYIISLTPGFISAGSKEYWTIYIDYNQNGSFADAGERVANGNSSVAMNLLIRVPSSANNGATRMRVQMNRSNHKTNSCTTFANGEVEDYTVVVSGNSRIVQRSGDEISVNEIAIKKELNVYPNPAKDQLTISAEGEGDQCRIKIYNAEGRELFRDDRFLVVGNNTIDINTSELSNGFYFITLESSGEFSRKKFFILK